MRMVINYKVLSKKTFFEGYFLPNKESLISNIKDVEWFNKFDCKTRYWQK